MSEPPTLGPLEDPVLIEHLLVANTDGRFGTVSRRRAHAEGLWHRSIGVWLYTMDRKVVLQKRSMTKDTRPGRWQMSVAGHVSSGQSVIDAALAEAKEEMGITLHPDDLKFVGVATSIGTGSTDRFGQFVNKEYEFFFIAEYRDGQVLNFNRAEVETVETVDIDYAFDKFRSLHADFCPMVPELLDSAYEMILTQVTH